MSTDATEWVPGDHIYNATENPHTHSRYIYNFRESDHSDSCNCASAAGWPEPRHSAHHIHDDPLAGFITEWHTWDQNGRPEAAA